MDERKENEREKGDERNEKEEVEEEEKGRKASTYTQSTVLCASVYVAHTHGTQHTHTYVSAL